MATKSEIAAEVRQLAYATNVGALATLSVDPATEGFPFGSVVPYALDEEGRPLILISDIAQHTRNVIADPRVSLLVSEQETDDPQAGWRVTFVGRMVRLERDGDDGFNHARYVAQVPDAPSYYDAHGFGLWRMEVARIRFIGGFGKIHWVESDDFLRTAGHSGFAEAAAPIVEHMNSDHADALIDYCKGLRGFTPAAAEMVGVEAAGFFVRTRDPDDLVYFPFGTEIESEQARPAFIELLKEARS